MKNPEKNTTATMNTAAAAIPLHAKAWFTPLRCPATAIRSLVDSGVSVMLPISFRCIHF
ncbi:hypothetical protein [Mycolicibacterium sp.]|uniref:hypothetical protein n=1 Tax=Mycolicibacterium sp. TaxID=2320850 RepID=UPI003D0AA2CE